MNRPAFEAPLVRFHQRIPRVGLLALLLLLGGALWAAAMSSVFHDLAWASLVANPFFIAAAGPVMSLWFALTCERRVPPTPTGHPLCNDCGAERRDGAWRRAAKTNFLFGGQCRRCFVATGTIGGLVYGGCALAVVQVLASVRWR